MAYNCLITKENYGVLVGLALEFQWLTIVSSQKKTMDFWLVWLWSFNGLQLSHHKRKLWIFGWSGFGVSMAYNCLITIENYGVLVGLAVKFQWLTIVSSQKKTMEFWLVWLWSFNGLQLSRHKRKLWSFGWSGCEVSMAYNCLITIENYGVLVGLAVEFQWLTIVSSQ